MTACVHSWLHLFLWCLSALISVGKGFSQVSNPYHMIGSARQDNCNCYTLTQDLNSINGSVWNIHKINLREAVDFQFSVYLGANDANGADGIAFVLQPISTQIGTGGGGLGFRGVTPSVGITIDTWQNVPDNDPAFDHIAIQRDGNLDHTSAMNLAGPVSALAGAGNVEDGMWHMLRIRWDPASKILQASMDGIERVSTTIDLISSIFNNDPMVYWGFTASTGGARNLQRFCTALDPQIKSLSAMESCFGRPIVFRDSSTSFSRILKWYWDFGDGSHDTVQHPAPHVYSTPGKYTVKLNILGNNGCLSDTMKKELTVYPEPFAFIRWSPKEPCEGTPISWRDSSSMSFGTINSWNWSIAGKTYTEQRPSLPKGLPTGTYPIALQVRTAEGCISSRVYDTIRINNVKAFAGNDTLVAIGVPIQLRATGGMSYQWQPANGLDNPNSPNPIATLRSDTEFTLTVRSITGCLSTDTLRIRVYQGPEIYVPSAFTPNGDRLNDLLFAIPVSVRFRHLHIYDRWGTLVFSTTHHKIGWDGRFRGIDLPSATFAWTTEGELADGRILVRRGTLQLIR